MKTSFLIKNIFFFFLISLFTSLIILSLFIDVHFLSDHVSETSVTEILQELFLISIITLYVFHAIRDITYCSCFILIAGFFCCLLIREMDFLFDYIAHGAWIWFALIVAACCIIYALITYTETLNGLASLMKHPSYGALLSGLVCILVFSRLFGMQILWQELMSDNYLRLVKNIVEEGTELFGYTLCLISTLWYLRVGNKLN